MLDAFLDVGILHLTLAAGAVCCWLVQATTLGTLDVVVLLVSAAGSMIAGWASYLLDAALRGAAVWLSRGEPPPLLTPRGIQLWQRWVELGGAPPLSCSESFWHAAGWIIALQVLVPLAAAADVTRWARSPAPSHCANTPAAYHSLLCYAYGSAPLLLSMEGRILCEVAGAVFSINSARHRKMTPRFAAAHAFLRPATHGAAVV